MKALSTLVLFIWCSYASAEDTPRFVWSYTMEEMHQMATHYKTLSTNGELDSPSDYVKAIEFKGYVAATLDNAIGQDKQLTECTRKYSVSQIAARTALVISNNPLDRSQVSAIAVHVALRFSCDESMWKKNK